MGGLQAPAEQISPLAQACEEGWPLTQTMAVAAFWQLGWQVPEVSGSVPLEVPVVSPPRVSRVGRKSISSVSSEPLEVPPPVAESSAQPAAASVAPSKQSIQRVKRCLWLGM